MYKLKQLGIAGAAFWAFIVHMVVAGVMSDNVDAMGEAGEDWVVIVWVLMGLLWHIPAGIALLRAARGVQPVTDSSQRGES